MRLPNMPRSHLANNTTRRYRSSSFRIIPANREFNRQHLQNFTFNLRFRRRQQLTRLRTSMRQSSRRRSQRRRQGPPTPHLRHFNTRRNTTNRSRRRQRGRPRHHNNLGPQDRGTTTSFQYVFNSMDHHTTMFATRHRTLRRTRNSRSSQHHSTGNHMTKRRASSNNQSTRSRGNSRRNILTPSRITRTTGRGHPRQPCHRANNRNRRNRSRQNNFVSTNGRILNSSHHRKTMWVRIMPFRRNTRQKNGSRLTFLFNSPIVKHTTHNNIIGYNRKSSPSYSYYEPRRLAPLLPRPNPKTSSVKSHRTKGQAGHTLLQDFLGRGRLHTGVRSTASGDEVSEGAY